MSVQQAGHAAVNASAAATEDVSLATSRWCRSRDCSRRATPGCLCCCCRRRCSCLSPSPCLTLAFTVVVGVGATGGGPPEDTMVPVVVGVE
jgi:hypothetical protein